MARHPGGNVQQASDNSDPPSTSHAVPNSVNLSLLSPQSLIAHTKSPTSIIKPLQVGFSVDILIFNFLSNLLIIYLKKSIENLSSASQRRKRTSNKSLPDQNKEKTPYHHAFR